MRRAGLSLIEVVIAAAILVVVILIITSLFFTTDTAYRTEVPIRDAQVKCQKLVDEIAKEISEGSTSMVWTTQVTTELPALPTDVDDALVFLSARDPATGNFVTDSTTMQPVWQKAVAYVPLRNAQGEVEIRRFDFGATSLPSPVTGNTPLISTTSANVVLDWAPTSVQTTKTRTSGILHLGTATKFALARQTVTPTSGGEPILTGGPFTRDVWSIEVSVSVRVAKGTTTVSLVSAIQGRN